jgi:signal peptidase I
MMNKLNNPTTWNRLVAITALAAVIVLGAAIWGPVYVSTGDSMEPTIQTPALSLCTDVTNPSEQINEGDIVGYQNGDEIHQHRVETLNWNGERKLTASLDNPRYDSMDVVPYSNVECKTDAWISLDPAAWF